MNKTMNARNKIQTKILMVLMLLVVVTVSLCGCGKKDVKPNDTDADGEGIMQGGDIIKIPENFDDIAVLKITVTDKDGKERESYQYANYNEFDYEALMAYRFNLSVYEPIQGCVIDENLGALIFKTETMPDTGLTQITYYDYSFENEGRINKKAVCNDSYIVESYSEYEYEKIKKTENIYSPSKKLIARAEYSTLSGMLTNYETYSDDGSLEESFAYYYSDSTKDAVLLSVKHYTDDNQTISKTDYSYLLSGIINNNQPTEEVLFSSDNVGDTQWEIYNEDTLELLGHNFDGVDIWYRYEYDGEAKMYNGKSQLLKAERRGPDEDLILATYEYEYDDDGRPTKIIYTDYVDEQLYYEYSIEYFEPSSFVY